MSTNVLSCAFESQSAVDLDGTITSLKSPFLRLRSIQGNDGNNYHCCSLICFFEMLSAYWVSASHVQTVYKERKGHCERDKIMPAYQRHSPDLGSNLQTVLGREHLCILPYFRKCFQTKIATTIGAFLLPQSFLDINNSSLCLCHSFFIHCCLLSLALPCLWHWLVHKVFFCIYFVSHAQRFLVRI